MSVWGSLKFKTGFVPYNNFNILVLLLIVVTTRHRFHCTLHKVNFTLPIFVLFTCIIINYCSSISGTLRLCYYSIFC